MSLIGDAIRGLGGRKFMFGVCAFLLTAVLLWFGKMDATHWVDYNKWLGVAFMGGAAIEGVIKRRE